MKLLEFFQDNKGKLSTARLIVVAGFFLSFLIVTFLTLVFKWSSGEFIAAITSLLTLILGFKLGQKPMETEKLNTNEIIKELNKLKDTSNKKQ